MSPLGGLQWNPFQIEVPNNIRFLKIFLIEHFKFQSLETLKISIFPRENHYFSGFRKNCVFAFWIHFGFKKPPKNPSKTKAERLENRCQKRVVFQHRFFRVLASILEPLRPSSWSQVGHFGSPKLYVFANIAQLGQKKSPRRLKSAKMKPQGAPRAPK